MSSMKDVSFVVPRYIDMIARSARRPPSGTGPAGAMACGHRSFLQEDTGARLLDAVNTIRASDEPRPAMPWPPIAHSETDSARVANGVILLEREDGVRDIVR